MICHVLAKVHSLATVCADGRLTSCTKVSVCDRTGCALPESLPDLLPGAGGRAATAGAKMHAVWDYQSRVCGHGALTPWHMPENTYVDLVVTCAHKGVWCLGDVGYFKVQALAHMAAAGAYFVSRLTHQTNRDERGAGRFTPLEVACWLKRVKRHSVEQAICLGAKAQVESRLMAARVPETSVHARRRKARKKAKKKGETPAQAHLTRVAWNLVITHVPRTLWQTDTVIQGYPVRWQSAIICKAWKSDLQVASIQTKKADSTVWYLYGRRLFILRHYALCPQRRGTLWLRKRRELSGLKRVRHFQAVAARWMQAIFRSAIARDHGLQHACAPAARLGGKASSKRRTTAQILRESLRQHRESAALAMAIKAELHAYAPAGSPPPWAPRAPPGSAPRPSGTGGSR